MTDLNPTRSDAHALGALPEGTLLAFDYGEKRIGVAVGELPLRSTHPLVTLTVESNAARFSAISALLNTWQPRALIVGLPTHMSGDEHLMTRLARKFAHRLHGRFGLPVFLVDERLTSAWAASLLNDMGIHGHKQKPALDQISAQAILMQAMENGAILV